MQLIPNDTDICVCVDLDEIFELGWSKILRDNWQENTGIARYRYTWNFNPDGSEGIVFFSIKMHKYNAFKWKYPVHEVLTQTNNENYCTITLPNIQLNHRADDTKSRSSYLPLLELSVKENPYDDRNVHYLGREYMFYGKYEQAIETLLKHLTLPTANWKDERCASMRYISKSYGALNNKDKEEEYILRAIIEAPHIREPYFEAGIMYFERKDYLRASVMFVEMLKISNRDLNYMSSPNCWSSTPYDYLSLCYYYIKDYKKAIEAVNQAITLNPNDTRLINNRQCFINEFNNDLSK